MNFLDLFDELFQFLEDFFNLARMFDVGSSSGRVQHSNPFQSQIFNIAKKTGSVVVVYVISEVTLKKD